MVHRIGVVFHRHGADGGDHRHGHDEKVVGRRVGDGGLLPKVAQERNRGRGDRHGEQTDDEPDEQAIA